MEQMDGKKRSKREGLVTVAQHDGQLCVADNVLHGSMAECFVFQTGNQYLANTAHLNEVNMQVYTSGLLAENMPILVGFWKPSTCRPCSICAQTAVGQFNQNTNTHVRACEGTKAHTLQRVRRMAICAQTVHALTEQAREIT